MGRNFTQIRLVVVQSEDEIYFDKYYNDALLALDKFNYFCKLANVNHPKEADLVFDRTTKYNEISIYFPGNTDNTLNQSGFVQVSLYFEVE